MSRPAADSGILVPVLDQHRFDEASLANYLRERLPLSDAPIEIRQFQGGLSNPTFHLCAGEFEYVLRKKPPGNLLPGAHAIEREYRIQKLLASSDVPVPTMHLLCTDEQIIGQAFYVMSYVKGRVFTDRLLSGVSFTERAAMYDSMNATLASLHRVSYQALDLEDFGKADNYAGRQLSRWARNYYAAKVDDLPAMDKLIVWLEANIPADEAASIVHGDFRIGNMLFHPTEPKIIAVLDWELSTIGHPIADLGYNCLPWRLPSNTERGFSDIDYVALGIPREADYVGAYIARTGREELPHWKYFLTLSMFRSAAILAGVYRRAMSGNAADAAALYTARIFRDIAENAWMLAQA